MKRLVFTGGHHTSSLEVAKLLKEKGWEIVWFGHKHTMWGDSSVSAEYTDVTAAGIKFIDLKAGKFYNTFNPFKLLLIPIGFIQAFFLLLSNRPQAIVSFGGYLAVPTVICGWVLGIKAITHEQTVVAGWANKLIAKFATKIAITWPSSKDHYPASKTVFTGLPTSSELKKTKTSTRKILLIVGGKQGSHTLNKVVFEVLSELVKSFDEVWHQTGTSSMHSDLDQARAFKFPNYHPFGYSREDYLKLMPQATVVLGRSGAHTVYDLGLLGARAVLVPIPWVSHQEQLKNAQMLAHEGLAVVLEEKNLTAQALQDSLEQALKLKPKALDLPQDATLKVAQLVEETAQL